jgi:hypothetical protein
LAELHFVPMAVLLWRLRFEYDRLAGQQDALRPGRARVHSRAERDRVIALRPVAPAAGLSHWSSRPLAPLVAGSSATPAEVGDLMAGIAERGAGHAVACNRAALPSLDGDAATFFSLESTALLPDIRGVSEVHFRRPT